MTKPNLVFMFGDDGFALRKEVSRWKKGFIAKHGDINLAELNGKSSVAEIAQSITTAPFLGEKRLVILSNFQNDQKADAKKELKELLEKLPDETVLVLSESPTPDKRSGLYKWLQKNATLKSFETPKGHELTQWVLQQMQGKGSMPVANTLIQNVGPNTWKLKQEIEKLILYAEDQPISLAMLEELVQGSVEQSIFTLTDQLAKRDHRGALHTLKLLQEQGNEAPYLFAMIVRQFRLLTEMKAHLERGLSESAIAKAMGIHPFVAKKTLPFCRNFTHQQLAQTLERLLQIDRRLKTGGIHLRTGESEHYLLAIEQILCSI